MITQVQYRGVMTFANKPERLQVDGTALSDLFDMKTRYNSTRTRITNSDGFHASASLPNSYEALRLAALLCPPL